MLFHIAFFYWEGLISSFHKEGTAIARVSEKRKDGVYDNLTFEASRDYLVSRKGDNAAGDYGTYRDNSDERDSFLKDAISSVIRQIRYSDELPNDKKRKLIDLMNSLPWEPMSKNFEI